MFAESQGGAKSGTRSCQLLALNVQEKQQNLVALSEPMINKTLFLLSNNNKNKKKNKKKKIYNAHIVKH